MVHGVDVVVAMVASGTGRGPQMGEIRFAILHGRLPRTVMSLFALIAQRPARLASASYSIFAAPRANYLFVVTLIREPKRNERLSWRHRCYSNFTRVTVKWGCLFQDCSWKQRQFEVALGMFIAS
jgi:hypothetical protein